jgi:hypothetical protein
MYVPLDVIDRTNAKFDSTKLINLLKLHNYDYFRTNKNIIFQYFEEHKNINNDVINIKKLVPFNIEKYNLYQNAVFGRAMEPILFIPSSKKFVTMDILLSSLQINKLKFMYLKKILI